MGMAASQARYLALVARKSNCEFEGQQINQARTALSNQSANLFNQMLGLQVPVPPSTQDFTKTQYSYSDGLNSSVISDWQQVSGANPDHNYVVTHYYMTKKYTGSMKLMSDPQVQFPENTSSLLDIQEKARQISMQKSICDLKTQAVKTAKADYDAAMAELKKLDNYVNTTITGATVTHDATANTYTVNGTTYTGYGSLPDGDPTKQQIEDAIKILQQNGALPVAFNFNDVYFNGSQIAMKSDLAAAVEAGPSAGTVPVYLMGNGAGSISAVSDRLKATVAEKQAVLENAEAEEKSAQAQLAVLQEEYAKDLVHPTYVGNCELTPLGSLDADQETEIKQVIQDLKEQGISSNLANRFDESGNYIGGIYSFKYNGVTYYTTYEDLENSYKSGTGNNNIDGQTKLPYYNASYIDSKVEKTEKALVETDGSGRFTSIRFENDSVTYKLNAETITDEAAYNDAMNQYVYENAKYDKMIQDINAKTSIIQHEDQQLELRLKQLDTEQNALKTEMEAVKKVVQDNIQESFKTFAG